jgi:hypothetical protein
MTESSGKEFHVGGYIFTAGFDSGNLGRVALDEDEEEDEELCGGSSSRDISPTLRPSTSTLQVLVLLSCLFVVKSPHRRTLKPIPGPGLSPESPA